MKEFKQEVPPSITWTSHDVPNADGTDECRDAFTREINRGIYPEEFPDASVEPTGWSSSYYELPDWAEELDDLIEYKNMNFRRANIFKAAYRLGDKEGTSEAYDLTKIIWFAERELRRIENEDRPGNSTS